MVKRGKKREMRREREEGRERRRDGERGEGGRAEEKQGSELAKVTKCEKDKACFTYMYVFFPLGACLLSH